MGEWNKKLAKLLALSGFVLGSLCFFSMATANDDVSELGDLDLGELLTLEVSSATGMAQSLSKAPAIIEVISRKQIQRRNYQSVAEALSSIPGLFVNYDYVFNDVGVRGVSGESRGASRLLKVLIDGHPISFRSETSNWLGPELIPMAAIERIEVIRGPGSALYGANAFLGVISIVTRKASDIGSTEVHAGGSSFGHWKNGYDFGITSGYEVGPFELLLSLQHQRKNRSGLSLPCTSFLNNVEDPESTFGQSANGCDYQKDKFQKEGVFDRKSFNDIESPTSFVGKLGFELSDVLPLVDGDSNLGKLSFFANLQSIDSRGSFSDWGMLNQSTGTQPDGTEVKMPRTGNRIGLFNSILAGSYSLELFNERVGLDLGMRYASGGVTDTERLKDISGQLDRSKYGYTGLDYYGNLRITALEDVGRVGSLTLIKNLTLVLGADQTVDTPVYIKKEGLSIMDNPTHEYASAELTNQGALGQITGSLLNGRVSVVLGARYDSNEGAVLEEDRISTLEDEEVERLCNGNQVCYESQNYRAGITFLLLKDFLELEGGPLVDELYSKILWGTAFKAPSPAFLYNSDILGERPFFPNPVLLPQDVSSL